MSSTDRTLLDWLPQDAAREFLLPRLDQRSRSRLSRTCRAWRDLCGDPGLWSALCVRSDDPNASLAALQGCPDARHAQRLAVGPLCSRHYGSTPFVLSADAALSLAFACPRLRELDLWALECPAEAIEPLRSLRSLEALRLRVPADAEEATSGALEVLASDLGPQLRRLWCNNGAFALGLARAAQRLGSPAALAGIVEYREVRCDALWRLLSVAPLPGLEELCVTSSGNDAEPTGIALVGSCPRLRDLEAHGRIVKDAVVGCRSLRKVRTTTGFGRQYVSEVVASVDGPLQLEDASLYCKGLSAQAMFDFLELCPCITRLSLGRLDLSSEATAHVLAALPGLRRLHLHDPVPPSPEALEALRSSQAVLDSLVIRSACTEWVQSLLLLPMCRSLRKFSLALLFSASEHGAFSGPLDVLCRTCARSLRTLKLADNYAGKIIRF
eukprot:m51a1_g7197 hypothetical protein (441) ;mRNA; r:186940-191881